MMRNDIKMSLHIACAIKADNLQPKTIKFGDFHRNKKNCFTQGVFTILFMWTDYPSEFFWKWYIRF